MNASIKPDPILVFSLFRELVSIGSESKHEGDICRFIKSFFSELGLECIEDDVGKKTGGECGNLLVTIAGGDSALDSIIFCSHIDTVVPGNNIELLENEDRFESDGGTILGADDKAGVTAMLAAARTLTESGLDHRTIELLFTVQEEIGLIGSKNLDYGILKGKWGVVLDGEGEVGGIVVKAPSQDRFKFKIHGRPAHAGVEPEKGISAISCAARAIAGLDLGRIDEMTTVNIGIIEGGKAINIIPDLVMVEGEIRSFEEERLTREWEIVLKAFEEASSEMNCSLDFEVERAFNSFEVKKESDPVKNICRAMEECGYRPRFLTSGGGSDTNVLNRMGFEMVTASIGLENPHSTGEFILKEQLTGMAGILIHLATAGI